MNVKLYLTVLSLLGASFLLDFAIEAAVYHRGPNVITATILSSAVVWGLLGVIYIIWKDD